MKQFLSEKRLNPHFHTKFPLLYVAISMIVAIVLVVECSLTTAWIVIGAVIAAGVVLEFAVRRREPLLLSLFALAALLLTRAALPSDTPAPYDVRYDALVVATADPVVSKKWQRLTADVVALRDSSTDWRQKRFSVFVNVDTALKLQIKRGDTLVVRGFLRSIGGNYGKHLSKKGIVGQFYSYNSSVIGLSDTTFLDRVNAMRQRAADRIYAIDTTAPTAAATFTAITIGLRTEMPLETVVDYRRTGVAHLIAISGLNIGIVVALLNLLLMSIRPWSQTTRVIYSLLIIAMLWGYTLFCGMSPSVLRAALMFSLYQIATMIYRDGTSLNVLSAAAVILLLIDPLYLYDLGFQLSFVAMAGIAVLYRPVISIWRIENRLLRAVWGAVVVALVAQVAVMPLSIYYFGYLPYLGLPVGLLLWAFVPVMIVSSILFLLTSWEWIGQIGIWTTELQNNLLAAIGESRWIVADDLVLPLWGLLLIYGVVIGVVVYFNFRVSRRLRRNVLRATYNI